MVNQYNGEFETREPTLLPYQQKVQELAQHFNNFQLIQINRAQNCHADSLSKLASSSTLKGRQVRVEKLLKPSIEEGEVFDVEAEND